ncbi:MAG: heavy-metal-associated domain-containing protein [Chloroflexi bacterium]|nr:heavy-metal-associated domain-containing protein [Chloroflexota bacterium]
MSAERLELEVPAMLVRPAVGTSCCVTPAEALIAQELWMLPGVLDAEIDARTGHVVVEFDPEVVDRAAILDALGQIGYPPAEHRLA